MASQKAPLIQRKATGAALVAATIGGLYQAYMARELLPVKPYRPTWKERFDGYLIGMSMLLLFGSFGWLCYMLIDGQGDRSNQVWYRMLDYWFFGTWAGLVLPFYALARARWVRRTLFLVWLVGQISLVWLYFATPPTA